jgi:hypothetical protein
MSPCDNKPCACVTSDCVAGDRRISRGGASGRCGAGAGGVGMLGGKPGADGGAVRVDSGVGLTAAEWQPLNIHTTPSATPNLISARDFSAMT